MQNLFKLSLPKLTPETAEGQAKPVLEKAQQRLGMVPNMYAFMANSPALLETYAFGYDRFRAESGFTPVEQEVVFLTISQENGCEYCMAAHSFVARQFSKVPPEITDAIRNGKTVPDARLRALSEFARAVVVKRGWLSPEDAQAFLSAGFTEKHILAVLLAVSVKTISNYANHLFQTPVDAPFASFVWKKSASA